MDNDIDSAGTSINQRLPAELFYQTTTIKINISKWNKNYE